MRRVLTTVLIVVVVLAVAFVGFRALRGARANNAPNVALAAAHYGPLVVDVSGSGTVQAASSVNVNPQEPGTVTAVPVQVGSRVQAGQILAVVADSQGTLASNLLSAESQLASDEASLNQLVSPTPASAATIQADEQRVKVDQQKVANDPQTIANQQQKIATDQQNIGYLNVTSPVSGVISAVNAETGQSVGQGTTLFQVVQPDSVEVQTSVPEIDLPNIYIGEGVQVWTQDQGTMNAAVSTVGVTSSGSNRQGALFPVTLTIENPPTGLRAGMDATANFTQDYLTESGTIAFAQTQAVTAQVSGTVESIALQAGQAVQSGESVLTLANSALQTQLAADQAQLNADETQLSSDEAQLASDKASLQSLQNPTPPSADQVSSLKAKIAVDQQNVQRARTALSDLDIRSPIAGIVTAVNVQVGDDVTQSGGVSSVSGSSTTTSASTAAFAVEDPNSLQVVVPVSEVSIAQVQVGQKVTVTADALPGQMFQGTVALISPQGTNSQGVATFNVIVDVAHPGKLLAGMSASTAIHVAFVTHALLVPVEAVSGAGSFATVQVMQGKHLVTQRVAVGLSNDVAAQILSGLSAGEQVVTATVSSSQTSGLGGGGGGGGGGIFRMGGGGGGQFKRAGSGGGSGNGSGGSGFNGGSGSGGQ